ncbi:MAG: single-stranded-DNA-specific exonuclease RecJ [Candidatus Shapirobacteria bacterium]
MNSSWRLKKKNPVLKKKLTPEKLLLALLWNRGVKTALGVKSFLNPVNISQVDLSKAGINKKETVKALKRIKKAVADKETILVYGDYDVDGFCATALVWEALHQARAQAIPYIPSRQDDGYGLKAGRVKKLKRNFPNLSLVITVDNGIVEHEQIKKLKEAGIEVIVTDHHLPQKTLPKALAIIHATGLSGSGVAYFLARELQELGAELPDLGLAALGTVADMMEVRGINRILIKQGIPYLENTSRVGLRRLFCEAGIDNKTLDIYKIGFLVAPRLNALGRIANPLDGLRLLCSQTAIKGNKLAKMAEEINSERKSLTAKGIEIAKKDLDQEKPSGFIFSASSSFHPGIVGLIASKLKDEFYRPAVIISKEEKVSRGSARSVEGLNIIKVLREIENIFVGLGGHALAAGFEIKTKNIPILKKKLKRLIKEHLPKKGLEPKIELEAKLSLSQVNPEYYQQIIKLAPFGLGNPEPLFLFEGLRLTELRQVGRSADHLKMALDDPQTLPEEKIWAEAIGFNLGKYYGELKAGELVDLAASLSEDCFTGKVKIVLKVKDLRPCAKKGGKIVK